MSPQDEDRLPQSAQKPRRRWGRVVVRLISAMFGLAVVLALGAVVGGYLLYQHYSEGLPDYRQLASYEPAVVTRVHAGDGRLLTEFAVEKRVFVPIEGIPKRVINAFLAAEDKTFYSHPGIDVPGIVQAAITNITQFGRRPVGASTITQQVAKNLFLWEGRSFVRKGYEAYLTLVLELCLSKDRILDLYLNLAEWGDGVFGAEAGARHHFGKGAGALTVEEAARMAAVLPSPLRWSPRGAVADRRLDAIFTAMAYPAPRE